MVYKSRFPWTSQYVSIPTFVFGPPGTEAKPKQENDEPPLIVDAEHPTTRFFTRSTYRDQAKQLALGLVRAGLQPGERIMVMAPNSIYVPVAIMGTIMAGGIYTSANPAFGVRELAYQMRDSGPRFVLADEACLSTVREAAALLESMKNIRIFLFDDSVCPLKVGTSKAHPKSPHHWDTLFALADEAATFAWKERVTQEDSQDTVLLVYSSGTTGLPKGVEITHFQVVSNLRQTEVMIFSDKTLSERRSLAFLPTYHGLGLMFFGFLYPRNGVKVFVSKRFNLAQMLADIERFRPTELVMVPAIVLAMAKDPGARAGKYDLSSVRKVIAGAAPLGMELTGQFEALWPEGSGVRIRQGWGMTECPVMSVGWHESDAFKGSTTSIGELLPGMEAKLLADNESGEEVTVPNVPGELYIRGPNTMKSYWNNPKATRETKLADGWLRTGDIAQVDEQGRWYMIDRKKDIMKVKGSQVAPAEIEALLVEHPLVAEAAVVGVPTADGDSLPRAFVIPRAGVGKLVTERDLQEFVERRLVKTKRLTGGVAFVEELPKTPVGKVQRKVLQALVDRLAKEGKAGRVDMARL